MRSEKQDGITNSVLGHTISYVQFALGVKQLDHAYTLGSDYNVFP